MPFIRVTLQCNLVIYFVCSLVSFFSLSHFLATQIIYAHIPKKKEMVRSVLNCLAFNQQRRWNNVIAVTSAYPPFEKKNCWNSREKKKRLLYGHLFSVNGREGVRPNQPTKKKKLALYLAFTNACELQILELDIFNLAHLDEHFFLSENL